MKLKTKTSKTTVLWVEVPKNVDVSVLEDFLDEVGDGHRIRDGLNCNCVAFLEEVNTMSDEVYGNDPTVNEFLRSVAELRPLPDEYFFHN
jgi:hypothetical protein